MSIALAKYEYGVKEIRVSGLIEKIVEVPPEKSGDEFNRIDIMMTAGDEARKSTEEDSILALVAVSHIYAARNEGRTRPREAFIINSLKHPEEVNALRRIYGNGFFLIGVYVEPKQGEEYLKHKYKMSSENARKLMERDEAEGLTHGQRTRDTFHLSDLFLHLQLPQKDESEEKERKKESRTQATLERFLDIIFADPYRTPLFDEYAMFMAFAAATRTADLSRQIGAVIARDEEVLASGVNECPRSGGGTYWPFLDAKGKVQDVKFGRDYTRECDSNDKEKACMIEGTISAIKKTWEDNEDGENIPDENLLRQALMSSPIDDITEYGRVVHAEMDALLTCARNNISCRGSTVYTTTFPCHNCAKHIIAAGIKRVVYIEPYPKSKALDFHSESAFEGFRTSAPNQEKVAFEPFVGVGPRRFFDLFSMKHGSGFPLKRKDKTTGKILHWEPKDGTIRMPMRPWHYLQREEFAVGILKPYLRGDSHDQPERCSCETGQTDDGTDASGNPESF